MIKVVVAHEHPIIRRGIRANLDDTGGYELVGETDNIEASLALCRQVRPNVLLLDPEIPHPSSLEIMRAL